MFDATNIFKKKTLKFVAVIISYMFDAINIFRKKTLKPVAVVIPLSNRTELTSEEEISLKHLIHYLGKYDKYFVMPKSLHFEYPGFGIKRFNNKYFGSVEAHNKLVLSSKFYNSFTDYKYILVYHLDSLVFSDQLTQWCNMDFDFIGPPWIEHEDAPYAGNPRYEGKVGNSGFALIKIESFLKVIYTKKYYKYFNIFNKTRREISNYKYSDDSFWANRATHYYPEFKIAPLETALRFGFECVPRYCFEKNNNTLPFGCHAWDRYDRDFWKTYFLKNQEDK